MIDFFLVLECMLKWRIGGKKQEHELEHAE